MLFTLIAIYSFNNPVQAELYKWVDKQGNTHYSDKNPEVKNLTTITPTKTVDQKAFDDSTKNRPILLPYGKQSRKIIVSDGIYSWKQPNAQKQKLGIYFMGRFCTSRGAIYASDVYSFHPRFIPSELEVAKNLKKSIVSLGYDSEIAMIVDLENRLTQQDALYLKAEIIDLNLQTCAPMHSLSNTISAKKVHWSNFTKNRAKITINWQLKTAPDQATLYETETIGYYDNWKTNKKAKETIDQAMGIATNNLFANEQFVNLITETSTNKTGTAKPIENKVTEQKTWWQKLVPEMDSPISNLIGNQFILRAKLASVLTEANSLKLSAIVYYQENGKWPRIKQDMHLSDQLFENHKLIERLDLDYDGSLKLSLREDVFGPSRVLILSPDEAGYLQGKSLNIDWDCLSNLAPEILPEHCEGI